MSQQQSVRLGALAGQWNVPDPEKLKAALRPDRETERRFYESDLGTSLAGDGSALAQRPAPERSISAKRSREHAQFEIYSDSGGEYRWRLRGAKGERLAASERSFPTRAACREAIGLVQRLGPGAGVTEQA